MLTSDGPPWLPVDVDWDRKLGCWSPGAYEGIESGKAIRVIM